MDLDLSLISDTTAQAASAAAGAAKVAGASSTVANIITSVGGAAASVINAVRGGSPAPASPTLPGVAGPVWLVGGAIAGAMLAKNRLLGAAGGAAAGFVLARMF